MRVILVSYRYEAICLFVNDTCSAPVIARVCFSLVLVNFLAFNNSTLVSLWASSVYDYSLIATIAAGGGEARRIWSEADPAPQRRYCCPASLLRSAITPAFSAPAQHTYPRCRRCIRKSPRVSPCAAAGIHWLLVVCGAR